MTECIFKKKNDPVKYQCCTCITRFFFFGCIWWFLYPGLLLLTELIDSMFCARVRCAAPPEDCVNVLPRDPDLGRCCDRCGEHYIYMYMNSSYSSIVRTLL